TPATPPSIAPPTASGDMIFDAWAAEFQARALAAGITPQVLTREMGGLTPPARAAIGQRRRVDMPQFDPIEERYGVPREILLGVWALESGFGAIQGDYQTIRSRAPLAAQGRRRAWGEGELIAALKIIQSGEWPRARLRGSWAGAMGQTQFLPSPFLSTAVDQDGDGKRDIWGSSADALASAANLLAKSGWVRGKSWAREVVVPPGFDFSLTE